jgi:CubicO group peptidase (beta-lactamase class C family)
MGVWLVLLLAVGGTTVSGFAQTNTQPVNQSDPQRRLDERAPIWLKAFNVTGIGIAYIEKWENCLDGLLRRSGSRGPLANEKTLYSVASLTKPITADIILRLASHGKLSLGRIDCRILDRS